MKKILISITLGLLLLLQPYMWFKIYSNNLVEAKAKSLEDALAVVCVVTCLLTLAGVIICIVMLNDSKKQ